MAPQHVDLDSLAELKEIMDDDFQMLIETYLVDADERVVNIRSAADAEDAVALRQSAHSFKGSSSNIGAELLAQLLGTAESMGNNNEMGNASTIASDIEAEYIVVKDLLSQQIH